MQSRFEQLSRTRQLRRITPLCFGLVVMGYSLLLPQLQAQQKGTKPTALPANVARQLDQTMARAIQFLQTKAQSPDGSYSSQVGPGVTALITTAVLKHGRQPSEPIVAKSLKYLEGFVQPSGGIHQKGTLYRNYETCLAILCFSAANTDGRYDKTLQRADAFIKGIQWDDGEGKGKADLAGGTGGGSPGSP